MKKTVFVFILGALVGAGGMWVSSVRAQLELVELNESMSLHQAVFGLEYYREHGPERIEWFLEHDVKCRGDAMRTNRELLNETYPKWFYEPELPLNGRTVERARELVGSELVCESNADA